ncbi:MAG: tRNA (guanosine(37)-N1)-methyltransferase TrmD [Thioalkalispiraceae bacterium]|jgi:tRNA (guanine37-N1)-methyltransferase
MQIDVVTLFPEMFKVLSDYGITGRAMKRGIVELGFWNPRDYCEDVHNTVDDRPYGGGPGMVLMMKPLREAIRRARNSTDKPARVVYLSPQGRKLDQKGMKELASHERVVLVCGRYEGIDERLISAEVDEEWSIGDYVLSGGELAAMVCIDGMTRLLPEALGHELSAEQDSFVAGLLDHPHYTRPEDVDGFSVPDILLSGDHAAINRWRQKQSLGRTWLRRPDLLEKLDLNAEQQQLLDEFIREYEVEGL